jgi:tetratricopeptide (TPR) repeat protein
MYSTHNLHFLAVAAAMAGHSKEASDAGARLAAHVDPVIEQMPMFEAFGAVPLLVATRQAQWGEVIKWPRPKEGRHATLAAWHFARGMAHASMKDMGPALQEQDAFAAEVAKAKDLPFGNNSTGQVLAVADHLLSGRIFAARGDNAAARRELELAVAAQDRLDYDEPPPFPWPVREALGAHLVRTGDPAAGEKVFREDLVKNPNNPRSLFGLAEALRARGRYADSDEARKRFQQHWSSADFKLVLDDF